MRAVIWGCFFTELWRRDSSISSLGRGAWVLGFRGRSYSAKAKRPFSAQAPIGSRVCTRKDLPSLAIGEYHQTARRRALAATNPLDKKSSRRAVSFFAR